MDRIPKERKHVVWAGWTKEERDCFIEAAKRGLTIQYFSCDQKWIDATDLDFVCTGIPAGLWRSTAFWIKEWNEPTGKELIGYLCWVWDDEKVRMGMVHGYREESERYEVALYIDIQSFNLNKYEKTIWPNARPVRPDEIKIFRCKIVPEEGV